MRPAFASLAKNGTLQVHRGRTRFQTLSWADALSEFGIDEQAGLNQVSEAVG